jgi:hypothetical protein
MVNDGIFISATTFRELAPATQADILARLAGETIGSKQAQSAGEGEAESETDEDFAELSPTQAREFLSGCGERTRKMIQLIAEGDSRHFQLADLAVGMGCKPGDLRGVWSGLTRRLYTILGNTDAYLIDWASEAVLGEEGEYLDHAGEVTEMTYQSFRKVLKLA